MTGPSIPLTATMDGNPVALDIDVRTERAVR